MSCARDDVASRRTSKHSGLTGREESVAFKASRAVRKLSLSKLKACGRRQASASNVRAKVADEIALRDFSVCVVRGELEELPEWLGLLMGGRDDMELMHFGQRGRRGRLSPVKKN